MVLHSVEAEDECYDWFFSAITGDLDRLKEMVSTRLNGGNLTNFFASYKGRYGQTVFHFAASAGSIQICQYLVEELNLNVDDFISDKGFTPLHSAIVGESFDVAFYLLDKGANPNAAENRGLTPLHMAATIGPSRLLEFLISKGAEIDSVPYDGSGTPLQSAAFANLTDNIKVLLDNNANPDGVLHTRRSSPLYLSIFNGSSECVKLMLQAGADPNLVSLGQTPLDVAAAIGDVEMIEHLLNAGADPNVPSTHLSNAGADPNVPNHVSFLPIEFAALLDRRDAVRCLLPVTVRISAIADWSVEGILKVIGSNEASKKMKKRLERCFLHAKSKGEEAFKQMDYYNAIYWYNEALIYFPSDPAVIYSNRSLCWIRLNKGNFALEDAKCCTKRRPDWPKAHYRAGAAWMLLKNYKNAVAAFSDACKLDPRNKELQNALRQAMEANNL